MSVWLQVFIPHICTKEVLISLINSVISVFCLTLATIGSGEGGSDPRSINDDSNSSIGRVSLPSGNLEDSKNVDVDSSIEGKGKRKISEEVNQQEHLSKKRLTDTETEKQPLTEESLKALQECILKGEKPDPKMVEKLQYCQVRIDVEDSEAPTTMYSSLKQGDQGDRLESKLYNSLIRDVEVKKSQQQGTSISNPIVLDDD